MQKKSVLIVDDEEIRESLVQSLDPLEPSVETAVVVKKLSFTFVLFGLKLPRAEDIEVLRWIKENWPSTDVIITALETAESAVEVMKLGAVDKMRTGGQLPGNRQPGRSCRRSDPAYQGRGSAAPKPAPILDLEQQTWQL